MSLTWPTSYWYGRWAAARMSACTCQSENRTHWTQSYRTARHRALPIQILGLINNLQLLLVLMLIFTAIVIHFCDRVGFDFGVSHLKGVVWNFIGLALSLTHSLHFCINFNFYRFIQKLYNDNNIASSYNYVWPWRPWHDYALTSHWCRRYAVKTVHVVEIPTARHTALYPARVWKLLHI